MVVAALAAGLAVGCGDGAAGGNGGDVGHALSFRELFRLGSMNPAPAYLFGGRRFVAQRGAGGTIYVLDLQGEDVRAFDAAGTLVHRFGGPGNGPGELNGAWAMGVDSRGRVWISSPFDYRYTVFDSAGTFIKTLAKRHASMPRYPTQLVFLGDGTFIDEEANDREITFVRRDTTGRTVAAYPLLMRPANPPSFTVPPDFDRETLAFLPDLVWTVAPDGTVWFSEAGRLELHHLSLTGDTLATIQGPRPAREISRDMRIRISRAFARVGVDAHDYEFAFPLVQAIHAADDGRILVQVAGKAEEDGRVFDVFSRDGAYLGHVDLGLRIPSVGLPALFGDTIVSIALDEQAVPYLVRGVVELGS